MRLSALELLMPGVASVSAAPGLTNDKLVCFIVINVRKNEMLSKDTHICFRVSVVIAFADALVIM